MKGYETKGRDIIFIVYIFFGAGVGLRLSDSIRVDLVGR